MRFIAWVGKHKKVVTSAGIVPRRHLTKMIYLKLCRPMDIPGDELLMSDVGTLTISLSKLCELKKKKKKSNKKLVSYCVV